MGTTWTKSATCSWATSRPNCWRPARSATSSPTSAACGRPSPGTRCSTRSTGTWPCSPGTARSSRWCSPASIRPTPSSSKSCATRSPSCSSTTPRCTTSRSPRSRWASGSAADSGLLHMEIVRERLEREFDLDLISTVPNVEYHVHRTDATVEVVENPSLMPHGSEGDHIEEPYVKARILAPAEYIGAIMKLGQERRGVYGGMHYVDPTRVEFTWEFPLGEIILDFYDKLKTISRGYASLDYEFLEDRPSDLVKLDMLLNGEAVDAFSVIIHRDK